MNGSRGRERDSSVVFGQLRAKIEPWEFCAKVLKPSHIPQISNGKGLDLDLGVQDRQIEKERYLRYRKQSIELIALVLGVGTETVRKWGERMEKMPEHHKQSLWWAWLVYSVSIGEEDNETTCYKFFKRQQNRQQSSQQSFQSCKDRIAS